MSARLLRPELAPLFCMIYVALVDGHLDPAELDALKAAIEGLGLDASAAGLVGAWLTEGPVTPGELARLVPGAEARRGAFFQAAVAAYADGTLVPGESRALESLARAFGIPDPERAELTRAAEGAIAKGVPRQSSMAQAIRSQLAEVGER